MYLLSMKLIHTLGREATAIGHRRLSCSSNFRVAVVFVLAAIAALLNFDTAFAAGRVALVYGNGNYQNAPKLANPANDAALIAASLKQVGFTVISVRDGDQQAMQKGLEEFGRKSQNADIALFYFAGHGIQVGGRNWLIPVDANIESSTDLPARAISANTVLELMELSGAKARIAILDACRNNPLSRSLTRASSRGLAKIDSSAAGSMIIFATAPGQVALDGSGSNSPFSKALAKQILTPGLEVRQMIGRVRQDVMADTSDKQVPWVNEAIVGEIYLASAPIENGEKSNNTGTPPVAPTGNSNNTALEIAFWETVKDSGDADMLNLYISKFPNGVFADIAAARIVKLKSSNTIPPKPALNNGANSNRQTSLTTNRSLEQLREMEISARKFIADLQIISSQDNAAFLNAIPNYYTNQVKFYGKNFSLDQVLNDKSNFVRRWPQRRYQVRPQTINVFCSTQSNRCDVEGLVDWEVQNLAKNKYISGSSNMKYKIEYFRAGPRVVREDGKVLKRN